MRDSLPLLKSVFFILLLAAVYFLTAKMALGMAENGYASPFWPPSGISLAALLLWGRRLLPGVFIGAFLVNWQVDSASLTALQIAIGNTLESLIALLLIEKFISRRYFLNYPRQLFRFSFFITIACAVGASIGSYAINDWQSGGAWHVYSHIWFVWWLGDLVGVLVFTPLLLAIAQKYPMPESSFLEKLLFTCLVFLLGMVIFGGWQAFDYDNAPMEFLTLPVLVAIGFRFAQRGVAITVCFFALAAINGTLAGFGPFVSEDIPRSLLLQQTYICCLAWCGLLLCAVVQEREWARDALQRFSKQLETRVASATRALQEKNEVLEDQQAHQKALIADLVTSEKRYQSLFDNAPEAVVLFSIQSGKFVDVNEPALLLFGYDYEQMMEMSVADISPQFQDGGGLSAELAMDYIKQTLAGDTPCFEWLHLDAQGAIIRCEVRLVRFPSDQEDIVRGSVINIRERIEAEERQRLTAKLYENTSEAVVITDADKRITQVNKAFTEISGYQPEEVLGDNHSNFTFADLDNEAFYAMWDQINRFGRWRGELQDKRKGGEVFPKVLSVSEVRNGHGEVTHYLAQYSDITDAKAREARLLDLATFDHLTGLHNRNAFLEHLNQGIHEAERHGFGFTIFFVDLDGFKRINDSLGHDFGDQLLCAVSDRLTKNSRASDLVARLGGDEFTLLIKQSRSEIDQARFAEKLLNSLKLPFLLGSNSIHITASIGISNFPEDGCDAKELLKNADLAMYQAKRDGRDSYQFYSSQMKAKVQHQMTLEMELRTALKEQQFELFYQPQLSLKDSEINGVEALLRWHHPIKGLILPGEFIGVAEQSGLINDIGDWALHTACRQAKCWNDLGHKVQVSVNISAQQFQHANYLEKQVLSAISESGIQPGSLELELTESILMDNVHRAIEILDNLRKIGVHVAIDDFGTGYSSLAYLKQFAADRLKIDRSFVSDLESDQDNAAIVRATIALAKSLNLTVIAEGVETAAQKAYLTGLGCDEMQGFYLSKAQPVGVVTAFLKNAGSH